MSGAEVVPFGKYKGQPVETLVADSDYCDWLVAQPWFSAKYKNVYNVVISYGAEPQDSPEHNQMQARFLDDAWCLALADVLDPSKADAYREPAARRLLAADERFQEYRALAVTNVRQPEARVNFEVRGWDVVFTISPALAELRLTKLPPCICRCDNHDECGPNAKCHGGAIISCDHARCKERNIGETGKVKTGSWYHCTRDCPWRDSDTGEWLLKDVRIYQPDYLRTVRIELKPDLGDDYPAVLRQVKGYFTDYGDRRCVVARRHAFEHVTWEQVRKIFAASEVTLLSESEIEAAGDPERQGLALVKHHLGAEVVSE